MAKTKKALILALSAIFVVCMALFTMSACKKEATVLDSIKISAKPTKITYVIGEAFDPAGMKVTATYKTGSETSTKDLEDSEWTYQVDETYLDASKKFKLAEGKTSASVKVTVSYTEGEVTKEATQNVTVTKPVKSISLSKGATYQDEYWAGQFFNADGLKIDIVYLDDSTENNVAIDVTGDSPNAKIDIDGAIPSGTTKIVLTYGGKTLELPITLLKGVWIEGETGLYNGEIPDQRSTNAGGQMGLDATLKNAETNAQAYFEAQLKADFALAELKKTSGFNEGTLRKTPSALYTDNQYFKNDNITVNGEKISALYDAIVNWLGENAEAVKEYVASDGYKAKVAEYIKSEQYKADIEHYRANNDKYLGGVQPGNTVSFVFSSEGASKGTIAFRLASCYLILDNNWTPKAMGDIHLNKFADVYVNGVKQTIADDVVLSGGMTPDGSANQMLWVNWEEVALEQVDFVAGRNVIEFRVKNHGITAPAQTTYNWSVNVDSMQITGDVNNDLYTFDNTKEITFTAKTTGVKLENKDGKAVVTVNGTYNAKVDGADVKGYLADKIAAKVGAVNADITLSGSNFTAVADVSALAAGEHVLSVANANVKDVTLPTNSVTIGALNYKFGLNQNSEAALTVEDTRTVEYKASKVELKAEDGKPYFIITGNVNWSNVSEEDIVAYLNESIGAGNNSLDFQGPLPDKQDRTVYNAADRIVAVTGVKAAGNGYTGTFTVKVDVSKMALGNFATHFGGGNLDFLTDAEKTAAKPDTLTDAYKALFNVSMVNTTVLKIGHSTYQLVYEPWYSSTTTFGNASNDRKNHFYGCVGLIVTNDQKLTTKGVSADIAVEDNKVVYIINGTYTAENYTEDELKAALGALSIDIQKNCFAAAGTWNGPWDTVDLKGKVVSVTVDAKNGTYQVKYDVTDVENYHYTTHYFTTDGPTNGDFKPAEAFEKTVTLNGKSYKLVVDPAAGPADNGALFWGCAGLIITDAK